MDEYLKYSQIIVLSAALLCVVSPKWRRTGLIIAGADLLSNFALLPFFENQSFIPTSRSPLIYSLIGLCTMHCLKKWGSNGWFRMCCIIFIFVFVNFAAGLNIITYSENRVVTIFWRDYNVIIMGLNMIQSFLLIGGIWHGLQYAAKQLARHVMGHDRTLNNGRYTFIVDHCIMGTETVLQMFRTKIRRED